MSITLVFYLISLLFEGKYRIGFIDNHINSKFINIIKISSNLNMLITSLFAIFFIILTLIICYFIMEIFHFKMSKNSIIQAFISLTSVFIAFQFIRLFIDIAFLQVQNSNLIDNESFLVA